MTQAINKKTMRRRYLQFVVICIAVVTLFISGCLNENTNQPGSTLKKIEIKTGVDDGGVAVLTDVLPTNTFGIINGGSDQPFLVGLITSGGGDNLTGRGIYRFNISQYKNDNFTFHIKCVQKHGNPGSLEVYITNDTGPLETNPSNMTDVSNIWNLIQTGEKITTINPSTGQWIKVNVSSSLIEPKITKSGYITIMLKIENEDLNSNQDYYALSTYEYAQGAAKPYLSIV